MIDNNQTFLDLIEAIEDNLQWAIRLEQQAVDQASRSRSSSRRSPASACSFNTARRTGHDRAPVLGVWQVDPAGLTLPPLRG
jgi:hypothetical protein